MYTSENGCIVMSQRAPTPFPGPFSFRKQKQQNRGTFQYAIIILQNIKPLRQEGTLCGGRPWEEIDDWETTKVEPADRQPHFSPSDKWDESFFSTFVVFTRLWTASRVMFRNQERLRMLQGGQGQQLGENKGHTVPPSGLRNNCRCMFNMRQWCFMPVTEAALFTCWAKAN